MQGAAEGRDLVMHIRITTLNAFNRNVHRDDGA
jgi:hypothetical protein